MPHLRLACLIIDLEVIPSEEPASERIIKVGALRTDTGATLERKTSLDKLRDVLRELELRGDSLNSHSKPQSGVQTSME